MSDLISRSELLKRLEEWNTSDETDKALYNFALHRIIEQPTVYSVDGVVEELEELKMRYFLTIANTGDEKSDFAYENVGNALDKAIEIVKAGVKNE